MSLLRKAGAPHVVRNALKLAVVVGTLLNFINQGPVVLGGDMPSWPHVVLNYLTPYLVASYSAVKAQQRAEVADG